MKLGKICERGYCGCSLSIFGFNACQEEACSGNCPVRRRCDLILCQITSQQIKDRYAVSIDEDDFEAGTLR